MGKKIMDNGFHERFIEVLNTEKNVWWERQLGVSNSLISSTWKKSGIPHVETIMKICELKGYSANWLLFGFGSKFMDDEMTGETEDRRRKMQEYIIKLEKWKSEYDKLLKEQAGKQNMIKFFVRSLSVLGKNSDIAMSVENMYKLDMETIFEKYLLPWQIFSNSLSDIVFKGMEVLLKDDLGKEFVIKIMVWIKDEFDKNVYLERGRLKELEPIFNSKEFNELISTRNKELNNNKNE